MTPTFAIPTGIDITTTAAIATRNDITALGREEPPQRIGQAAQRTTHVGSDVGSAQRRPWATPGIDTTALSEMQSRITSDRPLAYTRSRARFLSRYQLAGTFRPPGSVL